MPRIHFIEREGRFERVPETSDDWESGYWTLPAATASSLVGGGIYFHAAQREKSFFGGEILGFRVQEQGDFAGRVVFRFRYAKEFRQVAAGPGGWRVEKKLVV